MYRTRVYRRVSLSALVASVVVLAAPGAQAAVDTATFSVTASIADTCDVQATNHLFGAYSAASGTALDGASAISVYCTVGTGYALSLNVGSGGGAFTGRKLVSGGNELLYNLYTSAARSTVWGDGSGATATVGGTGAGLLTAVSHTVYGRISVGQDVAPGAYASTLTVTVTF